MCAGDGGACPRKGDELLLHVTVRTADEEERLLSSTRASAGGRDVPLRALLGDSCKLLRGVELSVAAFTRGERAVLLIPPEFAYGARHVRRAALRGRSPPPLRRPRHERGARPGSAARRVGQAEAVCGGGAARLSARQGSRPPLHSGCSLCLLTSVAPQLVTDVGGLVTKRILHEGSGLETPHAPYEVRRVADMPALASRVLSRSAVHRRWSCA